MRHIYCIYDKVAMTMYGALVVQAHDGPVARLFSDLLGDPEQHIAKHAADYELWCLATISDDLIITPLSYPRVVTTGAAFVAARDGEKVVADYLSAEK